MSQSPLSRSASGPLAGLVAVDLTRVPRQALNDKQVRIRNRVVGIACEDVGSPGMAGGQIKLSGFPDPTRGVVHDHGDRHATLNVIGG